MTEGASWKLFWHTLCLDEMMGLMAPLKTQFDGSRTICPKERQKEKSPTLHLQIMFSLFTFIYCLNRKKIWSQTETIRFVEGGDILLFLTVGLTFIRNICRIETERSSEPLQKFVLASALNI